MVQTPDGYIYAPDLQECRNVVNEPVKQLPASASGNGMWRSNGAIYRRPLANPPARAEVLKELDRNRVYITARFIGSMICARAMVSSNITHRKTRQPGDMFWADARGMRPIPRRN